MGGHLGPRARDAMSQAVERAEQALDLWLLEATTLDTNPGEESFYPDSLEVSTRAMFDRVSGAALYIVLNRREESR
jgi:hypothetical protein